MPIGVRIANQNNVIQVDGTYQNLAFIQKGTLSFSVRGGTPYTFAYYVDLPYPVSSRTPIIAVTSAKDVCWLFFDTYVRFFCLGASPGDTFDYYIFDNPDYATASGNIGFRIRNNAGRECFHSNKQYMRVVDSYSLSLDKQQASTKTLSIAGSKIAVAMGNQGSGYLLQNIGTPTQPAIQVSMWQGSCRVTGVSTYTITGALVNSFAGPASGTTQGFYSPFNSGMVLDVTGL